MKAYDTVNKKELDVDRKGLVDLMINNREVILVLPEKKTDEDGFAGLNKNRRLPGSRRFFAVLTECQ